MIVFTIVWKGFPSLSWEMISSLPQGGFYIGKGGGILNAIVGSVYLSVASAVIATVISIPSVLYMNLYLKKNSRTGNIIRLCLDVLCGIPSIVYGAFGFLIMISFAIKASLLGGIIALTLLILPLIMRAYDEAMQSIPNELAEASYSLGATKWETAFKVFLRQSVPALITATLLGFGRAVGDAASVLFTAGFSDYIPHKLSDATASLPLTIFFQLSSPFPKVREKAYAAALILLVFILIVSITSRWLTKKYSRYKI